LDKPGKQIVLNKIFLILRVNNLEHYLIQIVSFERPPEGHKLKQDTAEHPHVTLAVVALAQAHFRREIVRSSQTCICKQRRRFKHFRNSEVSYFSLAILRNQHVLGLQIAVENVFVVYVLEAQNKLRKPGKNLFIAKCRLVLSFAFNVGLEVALLTIVHYDAKPVSVDVRVVVFDDEL